MVDSKKLTSSQGTETSRQKVETAANKLREAMAALQALDETTDNEHLIVYATDGVYSAIGYVDTILNRIDAPEGSW